MNPLIERRVWRRSLAGRAESTDMWGTMTCQIILKIIYYFIIIEYMSI